jgi:hypothetical protein
VGYLCTPNDEIEGHIVLSVFADSNANVAGKANWKGAGK